MSDQPKTKRMAELDQLLDSANDELAAAAAREAELRAEVERLRAELIGELRSEMALAYAIGGTSMIAHCVRRLKELEAAEAAGEKST